MSHGNLYLHASIHGAHREDDALFLFSYRNVQRVQRTGLHIHWWRWSLWEGCGWCPLDTSVRQHTSLCGGVSLQTPQYSDHPDQLVTFPPGEQSLHIDSKPCSFGITQTINSVLVMYPLHAVTLLSLTNLGPIAWLNCGEGWMWAHTCPKPAFRFWIRLHHDVHEGISGGK